ncbi:MULTISPECIES: cold shock domain-containing protein [Nocardia]|uniref:CSD domain-containing protein n=1 Tax=Nocardia arthritidis TaxID=228602 RepID=A0A6G9YMI1_9NOCA|nr:MULTISPECIES: cold shock domain-containing protein [Nocardia]QIS14402.1 hypothetical protein F5544_32825 [Nocardia arthritidis]
MTTSLTPQTTDWLTGSVAWFDAQKGFGFIAPDGVRQAPVFVEFDHIDLPGYRTLTEGQQVLFRREFGPHGRAAAVVRPVDAPQWPEPL